MTKHIPLSGAAVLVPASVSFFDLHHIVQIAMGWTNSHLFEFSVEEHTIGYSDEQLDGFENVVDADAISLDMLLLKKDLCFSYLYDFGDYWKHSIVVEEVLSVEDGKVYPVCIDGKMNCPPEDCGAIDGFYRMLEILSDKKHLSIRRRRRGWGGDMPSPTVSQTRI